MKHSSAEPKILLQINLMARRLTTIRKASVICLFLGVFGLVSLGQASVRYDVDLRQGQTQRLTVEMTFALNGPLDKANNVELSMPAWRPGRYVILDSAGGVVWLKAFDQQGRELEVRKTDKATWSVATKGVESLRVEYELYANSLGLRTRHIDDSHAFLSGSAVFLYTPKLRFEPLEVHFNAPAGWKVAGGLEPLNANASEPRAVRAETFDVLIDSPIEVGVHDKISFEVNDTPHEIVVWPAGRRFDRDRLVDDFTKIIKSQYAIFRSFPYDRYVFLVHAGAGAGGGTEHLNSTIMQVPLSRLEGSLTNNDDYRRFLGLVSHEFFHTWNVKQMRPASMAPYDLQEENYSTLFWVAEGTTSYFDSLTLARTELVSEDDYLDELGDLIDDNRKRPGARVQSLSNSSFDAWVKFNRRDADSSNTTVSIYNEGALASLLLDLQIRAATENRHTLGETLRGVYEQFPLSSGGYSRQDLENTLGEVTGQPWTQFFADYVDGVEPLPLEEALLHVGLELYEKADKASNGAKLDDPEEDLEQDRGGDDASRSDQSDDSASSKSDRKPIRIVADTGATLRSSNGRAEVRSLIAGSSFYQAGILTGDEVVALNGRRIEASDWDDLVESFPPGEDITLHYVRHGDLRTATITLGERRASTWKLKRIASPTDQQKSSYESWLGRPWPEKNDEDEDGDGGTSERDAESDAP